MFVFQMGKVASASITKAVGGRQVHLTSPSKIFDDLRRGYCRHHFNSILMMLSRPNEFITAVREPVARNLSSYMQNAERNGWSRNFEGFLREFPHSEPLNWFDEEFLPFTGVDVFASPFPHERGWQIIDGRILILKAETSPETKEEGLSEFLRRPVKLPVVNVGLEKKYSDDYVRLQANRIPNDYLTSMYNSKYVKHFYTKAEIEAFRDRWSKGAVVC